MLENEFSLTPRQTKALGRIENEKNRSSQIAIYKAAYRAYQLIPSDLPLEEVLRIPEDVKRLLNDQVVDIDLHPTGLLCSEVSKKIYGQILFSGPYSFVNNTVAELGLIVQDLHQTPPQET